MTLPIQTAVHGAVLLVTLDNPARRNALTPEMLCRLADVVVGFARDAALRVAVVTGAGDQAFCAGGDLARTLPLMTGDRAPEDDWDRRLLADPQVMAASGLRDFPLDKPVVAAVNGICMAAGFELLLGTDLRIASEAAIFGLPEVQHALIPFAGALARLTRQLPYAVAMEIMTAGTSLDADTALRHGLINRIVPPEGLMEAAMEMANRVAANAPISVQQIKTVVTQAMGRTLDEGFALEDAAKALVMATDDAREGPRAFMEKRAPRYKGR